jgi:heme exporter protein CcmD
MSYTPFILSSYLISSAILLWVALSPVFKKRSLIRQLKARQARMDKTQ